MQGFGTSRRNDVRLEFFGVGVVAGGRSVAVVARHFCVRREAGRYSCARMRSRKRSRNEW